MRSLYIDSSSDVRKGSSKNKFFVLFLMVGILMSTIGFLGFAYKTAEPASAFGICGGDNTLGAFMTQQPWDAGFNPAAHTDKPNKTYSILEAFGGESVNFVSYYGEGGDFWMGDVGLERGKDVAPKWDDTLPLLQEQRDFGNCFIRPLTMMMLFLPMAFAHFVFLITTWIVDSAFNSKLICQNAGEGGMCIDLIGIIGGNPTDNTDGILGSLFNGLFMPLIVLVVLVSALTIAWQGLAKRQFRQAFGSLIWVLLSFAAGVIILTNPQLTAKAPTSITSAVASCVIGAFNGQSCMGDNSIEANPNVGTAQAVCLSDVQGLSFGDRTSLTIQSLNCSIWRAFFLEPWSKAQFGRSFAELDVTDPVTSQAITDAGYTSNDFCVNLTATRPQKGNAVLNLDSSTNKVCNLAAYQLYLQTKASSGGETITSAQVPGVDAGETERDSKVGALDTRWYKLVTTVAQNDNLWSNWAFESMGKIGSTGMIFISGLAGSVVILVISLYALVYLISAIILVALAPLFLLIGVHPTKGKRILLGYLEQIISAMLKYLASAGFLIMTLALYGAVLGTGDNSKMGAETMRTLIFIVLLSWALFMYRSEIVNLIGRVNMGGEQLSSQFVDKIGEKATHARKKAFSMGVSAVGANIGTRAAFGKLERPDGISDKEWGARQAEFEAKKKRDARSGSLESVRREMKSAGSGLIGKTISQATRQYERTAQDNRRDLVQSAQEQRTRMGEHIEKASALQPMVQQINEDYKRQGEEIDVTEQKIDAEFELDAKIDAVEDHVLLELKDPDFANYREMVRELREISNAKKMAEARGEDTSALKARELKISMEADAYRDNMIQNEPKKWEKLSKDYENGMMDRLESDERASTAFVEQELMGTRQSFDDLITKYGEQMEDYRETGEMYDRYNEKLAEHQAGEAKASAQYSIMMEEHKKLNAGEIYSRDDYSKTLDQSDQASASIDTKDFGEKRADRKEDLGASRIEGIANRGTTGNGVSRSIPRDNREYREEEYEESMQPFLEAEEAELARRASQRNSGSNKQPSQEDVRAHQESGQFDPLGNHKSMEDARLAELAQENEVKKAFGGADTSRGSRKPNPLADRNRRDKR